MGAEGLSDELRELAVAAREGDVVAMAAFARATYGDVWRFCASLEGAGSADDLTQEVYVRVLRALPAYRGDSSVRTWLFAIARHAVADAVRERRRRDRRDDRSSRLPRYAPGDSWSISSICSAASMWTAVSPSLTQVVGLTYAEAAAVSDCAVGTIRSRVARARAVLLEATATADNAITRKNSLG